MRQLDIFKGKRQRGRAPSPPKEFLLHCAFAEMLSLSIIAGWKWTHLPFGEHRNEITGARLKRMGTQRGYPDFMITGPGRTAVFIELKRKGERPTDEQLDVGAHLIACGFRWFWTSNMDSAIELLQALGAVRGRVSA